MTSSLIAAGLRAAVESALNLALSADAASQRALTNLAGKSIALSITDINLRWCIHLNYPIVLLDTDSCEANSQLTGRLQDFLGLSLKNSVSFSQTGVTHSGDIQLLNSCIGLLKNLDLDLGSVVSEHLGPLSGALTDQIQQVGAQIKHILTKMPPFFGDYLQHELQLTPSKPQIDAFTADIHELRSNVERLAARIERLNARLDTELLSQNPHV
ncbi:MAG TPA: SCP2 sterol-binding domain-containing protein [Cellvibrionaceae bacterium]